MPSLSHLFPNCRIISPRRDLVRIPCTCTCTRTRIDTFDLWTEEKFRKKCSNPALSVPTSGQYGEKERKNSERERVFEARNGEGSSDRSSPDREKEKKFLKISRRSNRTYGVLLRKRVKRERGRGRERRERSDGQGMVGGQTSLFSTIFPQRTWRYAIGTVHV